MNALLEVIIPVFLVIGFGYAATRAGLFSESAVDGLMRFAQNFAVPCLLFKSIATLDLSDAYDWGLMFSFYAGALTCFGLGIAGAYYGLKRPLTDSVAIGFACLFSNSLLLGLAITERAYGTAALAGNYAIISLHSPFMYGTGITLMELARSRGLGLSAGALGRQVGRAIFNQPLVIGITLGFVVNLSGLPIPETANSALEMITRSAIPVALFGLGGVLVRYKPEGDGRAIAMICGLSLILHPAITYGLGHYVFALDQAAMRSGVLTASMAPGVNAYLFAHVYGVAKRVNASAVLIATALSIGTVWFWLQLLA
jgi:malonate transporter